MRDGKKMADNARNVDDLGRKMRNFKDRETRITEEPRDSLRFYSNKAFKVQLH